MTQRLVFTSDSGIFNILVLVLGIIVVISHPQAFQFSVIICYDSSFCLRPQTPWLRSVWCVTMSIYELTEMAVCPHTSWLQATSTNNDTHLLHYPTWNPFSLVSIQHCPLSILCLCICASALNGLPFIIQCSSSFVCLDNGSLNAARL